MPSGRTIPDETRELILEAYRRGEECNVIAATYGVSRSVVTMSAHRAGISRHTRRMFIPPEPSHDSENVLKDGEWVWTNGIARWVPSGSYDEQTEQVAS